MWRKKILPYFQYTKKERTGILALVIIVLLLWIIPYFFSGGPALIGKTEIKVINASVDSLKARNNESNTNEWREKRNFPLTNIKSSRARTFELFLFDPNFTGNDEWEKLGLNSKTIRTIQNYLNKGGRFRKADDLQKVYGLKQSDYIRLRPFVRIKSTSEATANDSTFKFRKNIPATNSYVKSFNKASEASIVNINTAGVEIWEQLPGIGQKIAARILLFREKLGGFHSVEQVGETFGISPELFITIKPKLVVSGEAELRKININSSGLNDLKQHPYIGYKLASLIISYREQHGAYSKIDDLLQIPVLDALKWPKLSPYLTTGQN